MGNGLGTTGKQEYGPDQLRTVRTDEKITEDNQKGCKKLVLYRTRQPRSRKSGGENARDMKNIASVLTFTTEFAPSTSLREGRKKDPVQNPQTQSEKPRNHGANGTAKVRRMQEIFQHRTHTNCKHDLPSNPSRATLAGPWD